MPNKKSVLAAEIVSLALFTLLFIIGLGIWFGMSDRGMRSEVPLEIKVIWWFVLGLIVCAMLASAKQIRDIHRS